MFDNTRPSWAPPGPAQILPPAIIIYQPDWPERVRPLKQRPGRKKPKRRSLNPEDAR
jgi:hypothetical protein